MAQGRKRYRQRAELTTGGPTREQRRSNKKRGSKPPKVKYANPRAARRHDAAGANQGLPIRRRRQVPGMPYVGVEKGDRRWRATCTCNWRSEWFDSKAPLARAQSVHLAAHRDAGV